MGVRVGVRVGVRPNLLGGDDIGKGVGVQDGEEAENEHRDPLVTIPG